MQTISRAPAAGQTANLTARVCAFARRRRVAVTVAGSLATAAALAFVVDSHRHEFAQALSSASIWILLVAVVLQAVALLARTESWHLTIEAAGGQKIVLDASGIRIDTGAGRTIELSASGIWLNDGALEVT